MKCTIALLGTNGLPALTPDDLPKPGTPTPTWYFVRNDLLAFSVWLFTKNGATFLVYDFTSGHLAEVFLVYDVTSGHLAEGNWAPQHSLPPSGPPFHAICYSSPNGDSPYNPRALSPCRFILNVPSGWTLPTQEMGWTVGQALDWSQWKICVQQRAASPDSWNQQSQLAAEIGTSMAIPFGVSLAPDERASFQHSPAPRTFNGWTEAWSTELVGNDNVTALGLRAVSCADYGPRFNLPPLYANQFDGVLLGQSDRKDLVALTSGKTFNGIPPTSLETDYLIYSPAGTSLATRGDFSLPGDPNSPRDPSQVSLLRWSYAASAGRDESGHSASVGYVYPFGHRVIVASDVRRVVKFAQAVLDQVQSISLLDRQMTYTPVDFQQPFQYVKILNVTFPEVSVDAQGNIATIGDNTPLKLQCEAKDQAGNVLHFQHDCRILGASSPTMDQVAIDLGQQQICFANPPNGPEVMMMASQITLSPNWPGILDANGRLTGQLFTVPGAKVNLPAVDHFMASPPSQPQFRDITFLQPPQTDGVFASLVKPETTGGSTDRYGAFAGPNLRLTHLSVDYGAISLPDPNAPSPPAGAPAITLPSFDNFNIFGFNLGSAIIPTGSLPPPQIAVIRTPTSLTTTSLTTTLNASILNAHIQAGPFTLDAAHIDVKVVSVKPPAGDSAHSNCTLSGVQLAFGNLIEFDFKQVSFTAIDGQKPNVSADYSDFQFLGALSFINEIFKYIPKDSFSNPPDIQITSDQAHLGYTQAVPAIAFGVFSFSNMSLGAALDIPFLVAGGSASSTFNLSTVERPFTVSAGIFGGGGSLAVKLSPKEFGLAALIDFGGVFAFNAVVASGAVSLTAGLILRYDQTDGLVVGGNVHLSGAVEVLDLISVSLDVCLTLIYSESDSVFTGSAEVSVRVDVAFFHKSVSFTASRSFSASGPAMTTSTELAVRHGLAHSVSPGIPGETILQSAQAVPPGSARPPVPADIPPAPHPRFLLKHAMPSDAWLKYQNAFEPWSH